MSEKIAASAETPGRPRAPDHAAAWEDLVDIFASPREVFRRRTGADAWLPFLTVIALAAALTYFLRGALQPIADAEYSRDVAMALAKQPDLSASDLEVARPLAQNIAGIVALLSIPIGMLLGGLGLWLANKVARGAASFADAMLVVSFAWYPRILGIAVGGVMALAMPPESLTSRFSITLSAARFVDPDSVPHALWLLLGRIDVFVIWQFALVGLGIAVKGKLSWQRALACAAALWLAGSAVMAMR